MKLKKLFKWYFWLFVGCLLIAVLCGYFIRIPGEYTGLNILVSSKTVEQYIECEGDVSLTYDFIEAAWASGRMGEGVLKKLGYKSKDELLVSSLALPKETFLGTFEEMVKGKQLIVYKCQRFLRKNYFLSSLLFPFIIWACWGMGCFIVYIVKAIKKRNEKKKRAVAEEAARIEELNSIRSGKKKNDELVNWQGKFRLELQALNFLDAKDILNFQLSLLRSIDKYPTIRKEIMVKIERCVERLQQLFDELEEKNEGLNSALESLQLKKDGTDKDSDADADFSKISDGV